MIIRPTYPIVTRAVVDPIAAAGGLPWQRQIGGNDGSHATLAALLGTECTLWLDERGQTDSGAGKLTAWRNNVDLANPITQSTDGNRPALGQTIGVYSAPDFDGVDDFIVGLAISNYVSQTLGWHSFAVVNLDAHDAADGNFYDEDLEWGDATGYVGHSFATSGSHAGHFDGTTKQTAYNTISNATNTLVESSWDATTITSRVAGGAATTVASGTPDVVTGLLRVGSRGALGKLDGRLAFLAICNRKLSAARANAIRAILATKYGVSA